MARDGDVTAAGAEGCALTAPLRLAGAACLAGDGDGAFAGAPGSALTVATLTDVSCAVRRLVMVVLATYASAARRRVMAPPDGGVTGSALTPPILWRGVRRK